MHVIPVADWIDGRKVLKGNMASVELTELGRNQFHPDRIETLYKGDEGKLFLHIKHRRGTIWLLVDSALENKFNNKEMTSKIED
jgi:hypothetical protein